MFQRIYFPLWFGAGVETYVPLGCEALYDKLGNGVALPVPTSVNLEKTDFVKAKPALLEVFSELQAALKNKSRVALLGGDCSSDFVLVSKLSQLHHQDFAVVWLDTHADLNTPVSSPSGHFHGMVLRAMLGDSDTDFKRLNPNPIQPAQVFLAGVREFDPPELEYVQQNQIHCSSVTDLKSNPNHLAAGIRQAGFGKVYVHLDLDVLDSFGSSAFSSAGGLPLNDVLAVIRSLKAQFDLIGFAVTEYAPVSDGQDLETVVQIIHALEENP